jgi:hypothetical protein
MLDEEDRRGCREGSLGAREVTAPGKSADAAALVASFQQGVRIAPPRPLLQPQPLTPFSPHASQLLICLKGPLKVYRKCVLLFSPHKWRIFEVSRLVLPHSTVHCTLRPAVPGRRSLSMMASRLCLHHAELDLCISNHGASSGSLRIQGAMRTIEHAFVGLSI